METVTSFFNGNSVEWLDNKFQSTQNPFGKHVLVRMGYLGLVPLSAITCVLDVIIGLGASVAAIVTLGTKKQVFQRAMTHLSQGKGSVLALPFFNLLKTINPNAQFSSRTTIGRRGDGFLSEFAITFFRGIANNCYTSQNLFTRHVLSRFTYGIMIIGSAFSRVADLAIGLLAALGAIITLGKFGSLNNLAYRGLQAPNIIKDLSYCVIKMINPWAGVYRYELHN